MAGGVLCLVGACAIAGIEDAPFHQCLFEAVSAFGTVGVSMGLTPTLAAASRVILIVMMYMGRVGVLTLGVAVFMLPQRAAKAQIPGRRCVYWLRQHSAITFSAFCVMMPLW